MITIDNNVPLPSRSMAAKYPFAAMQVGDSFALPKDEKGAKSISAAARSWATGKGFPDRKFSMRSNGTSVRVWRVA